MSEKYDIAVVGGGPAGSSLAIRLASNGKRVVLFEQKTFPRPKLCGEFVSPECIRHFDELGVMKSLFAVNPPTIAATKFYSRSGRSVSINSKWFASDTEAIGLSRAELDRQLLLRAREMGVDVYEGATVAAPVVDRGRVVGLRVRVAEGERIVDADVTIDATGRARAVGRHLNDLTRLEKPGHVAFKVHLQNALVEEGVCEIYSYAGGYGGCNAVEGGLVNLCFIVSAKDVRNCGSNPIVVMENAVFGNKRAAHVLSGATVASDWLAVPITRFGRTELAPAEGLLTVGDAASFIDPFTGSGILMALESSRLAAEAILTNGSVSIAQEYRRTYSAAFDRRLWAAGLIRHAAYVPGIATLTIGLLSLSSSLRRQVARATRGRMEKIDSLQA